MSNNTNIVVIDREFITLTQLLKALGIIQTGGEAKRYLSEHLVQIDGQIDQRRGRKIYPHSTVNLLDSDLVFIIEREENNSSSEDKTNET